MKLTTVMSGLGLLALLPLANGEDVKTAGQGKVFPADIDAAAAAKAKRDLDRLLRASASWDKEGR